VANFGDSEKCSRNSVTNRFRLATKRAPDSNDGRRAVPVDAFDVFYHKIMPVEMLLTLVSKCNEQCMMLFMHVSFLHSTPPNFANPSCQSTTTFRLTPRTSTALCAPVPRPLLPYATMAATNSVLAKKYSRNSVTKPWAERATYSRSVRADTAPGAFDARVTASEHVRGVA
jgi:hypothetical protein